MTVQTTSVQLLAQGAAFLLVIIGVLAAFPLDTAPQQMVSKVKL